MKSEPISAFMASYVGRLILTFAILLIAIVFSEGRVLKAIGKGEIGGHENQAMVVDSHQNDEGDGHGYDLPSLPHDYSVTGKKDKDKDKDTPPTMTVDHRRRLAIDNTDGGGGGGGGYEEDFRPIVPSSSPGVRHSSTPIEYAGEEQP